MSAKWKEIARLRFKGEPFSDRALDAVALSEVQRFLRLLEETAKSVWRSDNPERERLPAGFDERNRAFLRAVRAGSAVAVIESRVDDADQMEFLDREAESMVVAADLTYRAFDAAARMRPLPERVPRELVSKYIDLGVSLPEGTSLEILASGRKRFVPYRSESRERLKAFALQPYEDRLDVTGELFEADVRQSRFQIWTERYGAIPAPFAPEQEATVTTALKDHHSVRVRISGVAAFTAEGKPTRFLEVRDLVLKSAREELLFDPSVQSIEEEIDAIWNDVSDDEWKKLPADLSANLDHYLYGTPKQ